MLDYKVTSTPTFLFIGVYELFLTRALITAAVLPVVPCGLAESLHSFTGWCRYRSVPAPSWLVGRLAGFMMTIDGMWRPAAARGQHCWSVRVDCISSASLVIAARSPRIYRCAAATLCWPRLSV